MGGLLLAVGLLHAPGQAGIGQQAGGEVPVALAVLGGDRACGQGLLHVEAEQRLRIGGKQLLADRTRVQVLEDHRIAAQSRQRRPWLHGQAIAHSAADTAAC
ncbi:hypothetical protein AZ54_04085 [Xanthomonas oryzae pv. oryzae PXO86]|nr:hypothetical protein AZ54_04085 [Xanthomonas oryzae pv. oryzae PXO86]